MADGSTALILAARLAVEGMVEDLIASHADVNAVDVARCAQQLDDRQLWKLCYLLQSEDLAKVLEQAEEEYILRLKEKNK